MNRHYCPHCAIICAQLDTLESAYVADSFGGLRASWWLYRCGTRIVMDAATQHVVAGRSLECIARTGDVTP